MLSISTMSSMENSKVYIAALLFLSLPLFAESLQTVRDKLHMIEDTSGLTPDEVRQVAKKFDAKEKLKRVNIRWEELSPTPVSKDWIQTKSGEWFKGKIKAMYNEKLEFHSDEIGDYTFDFDDIKQIKSHQILSVNIENYALVSGVIRLKGDEITIIQGDVSYSFKRDKIISFAPDAKKERNYWSGKVTFSFDVRTGNTDQVDYSGELHLKRRTAKSLLNVDYLGRISSKESTEIANDHRLSFKYDRYITRYFFWTPISAEYYTDRYKNIANQITAGAGIGYTIYDNKSAFWTLSGGPAVVYTEYVTVEENQEKQNYSPAAELSTKLEYELSKITDIKLDYKITLSDNKVGRYKHHMVMKLENKLLSWLDLDLTGVWDYVASPQEDEQGNIPQKSDFQFLVGVGVDF